MAKPKDKDDDKLGRKRYEKELQKLQRGLCRLQEWVKHAGLRVIVIFEGRDGAGKGGTIRAITERVSPRVFRVVALLAACYTLSDTCGRIFYVIAGEKLGYFRG